MKFFIFVLRIMLFVGKNPLVRKMVFCVMGKFPALKKTIKKLISIAVRQREGEVPNPNYQLRPELIDIFVRLEGNNRTCLVGRQLFIDVSEFIRINAGTGIQRLVYNVLLQLSKQTQSEFRIEPVYALPGGQGYHYARYLCTSNTKPLVHFPKETAIKFREGDIFLGLDFQPHIVADNSEFYRELRDHGVRVKFIVNDLLPVFLPDFFSQGAFETHTAWLKVVAQTDGAICVSKTVADELKEWLAAQSLLRPTFRIDWFHLGADIDISAESKGKSGDAGILLSKISTRPTFLMVGTLEPRKGYAQTLAAFELLWEKGVQVNLALAGKIGWIVEPLIQKILTHSELNNKLFWIERPSDECLNSIYESSTCLIAASEGEGFGLPLIEAAKHRLPIIARDIPIFREVAGKSAFYFSGLGADDLKNSVEDWLELYEQGSMPDSSGVPWLTWKESTQSLMERLLVK